ncbi:MAG: hypothetical protein IJS08_02445, partial [Victivallales bacterium]|nr:hypothetical protein [Victivallales bacterium]
CGDLLSCKRQEASWANDPKFEKLSAFGGIRMHRLIKTIFRLVLWAVVIASAYYGLIALRTGATLRKQYLNEMHDTPCKFRLDATKENHIQVPFHHSFDGLHGCVLCISKSAVIGQMPAFTDASFMVFSLLDGDAVVAEGDNETPCKDVLLEDKASTDLPLAYLWRLSPHIPHKDYILDVKVKKPFGEVVHAELPIVARYNPCGMIMARAYLCKGIGIVLCLLAFGVGGWMIARHIWRKRPKQENSGNGKEEKTFAS